MLKIDIDWYQQYLDSLPASEFQCTAEGKNPSQEKIETYCRRAVGGEESCPNLIEKKALRLKKGTRFGNRRIPVEGVNIKRE